MISHKQHVSIFWKLFLYSPIRGAASFAQTKNLVHSADAAGSLKILHSHLKSERVGAARELFVRLPERSTVGWTMMIHGFARHGYFKESLKLFSGMLFSGLLPNSFTMVALLVCSGGMACLKLAWVLHGWIVKAGVESELHVGTALLDTYAKCGELINSVKVFERMKCPNLVSFNAMITGFVRGGLPEKAILMVNRVLRSGLAPNSTTMLSVIQACILLKSVDLCECVHCYVVKSGLLVCLDVENSLLDMHLSLGNLAIGADLFDKMGHKDVVTWTTMMGFFASSERPCFSLKLYNLMRNDRVDPDMVTMVNLLSASAKLRNLNVGRLVHNQAIVWELDVPVNLLISMYSKCGDMRSAQHAFNYATERCLASWTIMIAGYASNGQPTKALEFFGKMRPENRCVLDPILVVTLGTACGEVASLELCKQVHSYVIAAGFHSETPVQNILVATYAKCGNMQDSYNVFKAMEHRNVVSWNSLIYGYGINGNGRAALALFHEMQKAGEEPNSVSYLCVLNACSHSGMLEEALEIFDCIFREKMIMLTEEHCGCVADMLARAGRLEEARKYSISVPQKLGGNVWRAILGGCRAHGNVELAEIAGKMVLENNGKDSGNLVLLSNVYNSVGMFGESEALRSNMKKLKLRKNHGISLLDAG